MARLSSASLVTPAARVWSARAAGAARLQQCQATRSMHMYSHLSLQSCIILLSNSRTKIKQSSTPLTQNATNTVGSIHVLPILNISCSYSLLALHFVQLLVTVLTTAKDSCTQCHSVSSVTWVSRCLPILVWFFVVLAIFVLRLRLPSVPTSQNVHVAENILYYVP